MWTTYICADKSSCHQINLEKKLLSKNSTQMDFIITLVPFSHQTRKFIFPRKSAVLGVASSDAFQLSYLRFQFINLDSTLSF